MVSQKTQSCFVPEFCKGDGESFAVDLLIPKLAACKQTDSLVLCITEILTHSMFLGIWAVLTEPDSFFLIRKPIVLMFWYGVAI